MFLYLAYATVAEASPLEGTIGKWLLSIRVVDLDGTAHRPATLAACATPAS